MAHPIFDHRI